MTAARVIAGVMLSVVVVSSSLSNDIPPSERRSGAIIHGARNAGDAKR